VRGKKKAQGNITGKDFDKEKIVIRTMLKKHLKKLKKID